MANCDGENSATGCMLGTNGHHESAPSTPSWKSHYFIEGRYLRCDEIESLDPSSSQERYRYDAVGKHSSSSLKSRDCCGRNGSAIGAGHDITRCPPELRMSLPSPRVPSPPSLIQSHPELATQLTAQFPSSLAYIPTARSRRSREN